MVVAAVAAAALVASCAGGGGAPGSTGSSGSSPALGDTVRLPTEPSGSMSGTAAAPPTTPASPTLASPTLAPTSAPSTTAAAVPRGPFAVATSSLDVVDESRPTVSRGRTISSSRSLPTTVFHPVATSPAGERWPLLVFAHGFEIGPGPYERVCRMLASRGYVVAAPSFPLTDRNAAGTNLDRGDLANQAADVAVVIDAVLAEAERRSSALAGRVDGARIGVIGHSDGADTALDVAYYPGRTDPRVRAVVAMSPDAMAAPGGTVGADVPLLVTHGDRDTITPFSNATAVIGQVRAHRFLLVLVGGGHLEPVTQDTRWTPALDDVTVAFLDRYLAGRTGSDDAILAAGDRPGLTTIRASG